jgi:hypothetical protein
LAKPSGQKENDEMTVQQNLKILAFWSCKFFQIELKPITRSRGAHKPLGLQAYRLRPAMLGQTKCGPGH